MRGYNQSSKLPNRSDYKLSCLINDIKLVIEKLNHSKAILVGHDWGGAIAWAFAYVSN